MTCESAHELIQPLLDEELDLSQRMEIEAHLRSCVACAEFHHQLSLLRTAIRSGAPYYQAPQGLEGRVRSALRQAAPAEMRPRARSSWAWFAAAASLGFAAAMIWGIVALRSHETQPDLLAQQIVASHVRSLMAAHLMDVPSTDRHTVKPWFNGKLDFAPQVKDLSDEGFPLRGGRLDYLDDRPVAALVYQRRQHVINVFVWPFGSDSKNQEAARTLHGFNIVHWTDQGLGYWAVSDVNTDDLREFERLYQK